MKININKEIISLGFYYDLDENREDGVSQITLDSFRSKELLGVVKEMYEMIVKQFHDMSPRQIKKYRKIIRKDRLPKIKQNYIKMCNGDPWENSLVLDSEEKLEMFYNHISDITWSTLLGVIPNDERNGLQIMYQYKRN